jgi:hypothetical protein
MKLKDLLLTVDYFTLEKKDFMNQNQIPSEFVRFFFHYLSLPLHDPFARLWTVNYLLISHTLESSFWHALRGFLFTLQGMNLCHWQQLRKFQRQEGLDCCFQRKSCSLLLPRLITYLATLCHQNLWRYFPHHYLHVRLQLEVHYYHNHCLSQ